MEKVTRQEVLENMQDFVVRTVTEFGKPYTLVTVRMKNGFILQESTTCVDPAGYSEEIAKQFAWRRLRIRFGVC